METVLPLLSGLVSIIILFGGLIGPGVLLLSKHQSRRKLGWILYFCVMLIPALIMLVVSFKQTALFLLIVIVVAIGFFLLLKRNPDLATWFVGKEISDEIQAGNRVYAFSVITIVLLLTCVCAGLFTFAFTNYVMGWLFAPGEMIANEFKSNILKILVFILSLIFSFLILRLLPRLQSKSVFVIRVSRFLWHKAIDIRDKYDWVFRGYFPENKSSSQSMVDAPTTPPNMYGEE